MKKLYRARIVVDTLVYLDKDEADDNYAVVNACHDALDCETNRTVEIKEIDWSKRVTPQFPPAFTDPDLVPENGGPKIREIAEANRHYEDWISHRPHEKILTKRA